MSGRTPSEVWRKHVSAIIAGALVLGLFSSVALADPAAFGRAMGRAKQTLFGAEPAHRARRDGQAGITQSGISSLAADCSSLIAALEEANSRPDDVRGIQRAIEVVKANCGRGGKGYENRRGHRGSRRVRKDPGGLGR